MAIYSKGFLLLGLLLAVIFLLASEAASQKVKETNAKVEDAKYGGYPGGGYGGYPGQGGYGGYPGRGGGYGGYPGRGGGGGYCRYGCCRRGYYGGCRRCCSYAGEVVDAQLENQPHN